VFRDDAQAARALLILLGTLSLDHLWSPTGPSPSALALRGGGTTHGLSPAQQTLLGAAWALWDRKTPAGVRLQEVIQHLDRRTCDALFSLVIAYLEGPKAVDAWLDCASRRAHAPDRAPAATAAAGAAAPPSTTWIETLGNDWPTLDLLSLRYIRAVIEQQQGNQARAAEVLGVDRRTLSRVLAKVRSGRIPAMQTRRY
jgi:ActR/RegA family two-component response regulator